MNDDHLHPLHELASAYVDGDVTAREREQVESSAELTSLVASFHVVRRMVGDIAPPSPTTRDAALSAALAEFDGADAVPPHPTVVDLASRRRWPITVLSAAAAAVLVGVVAVALLNGRGSDSKASSATVPGNPELVAADAVDSAIPAATIGSINGGVEVALVIETPEELQALPTPPQPDAAPADTAASAASEAADTSFKEAAPVARPALACLADQQVFLADIQFRGTFAIAARDLASGITQAIADDCTVLASVGG